MEAASKDVTPLHTRPLPPEIWYRVFGMLDLPSAVKASAVSRGWAKMVPGAALSGQGITQRIVRLIRDGCNKFEEVSDIGLVYLVRLHKQRLPLSWYLRNEEPWTLESVRGLVQIGMPVTHNDLLAALRSGCDTEAFLLLLGKTGEAADISSLSNLAAHSDRNSEISDLLAKYEAADISQ